LSSIDPRQAAFQAAEEAQRRAAEEALQRAAERAREEARARKLAQQLSSALESRKEAEVARVLRDAESLGSEARARFLEEAGARPGRAPGERVAGEALRARIGEAFPEASDGRHKLGEAFARLRGEDPRRMARESLESLVSETLARLEVRAATARPERSVVPTSGDRLERAPDVSLFGGGARPAGVVAGAPRTESGVMPRPAGVGPPRVEAAPARELREAASVLRASVASREPSVSPSPSTVASPPLAGTSPPAPSAPLSRVVAEPPADRSSGPEAVRARAAEVALDREDLAAALGMGPPRVIERAASSAVPGVEPGEVAGAEVVQNERVEVAHEKGEGFFARLRQTLVLTPSVAEAVVAPGVSAVGGTLELAAKSLARAREAIADGGHENVRVQYGLSQAGGLFKKIAAHLKQTEGLVAREISPAQVGTLRQTATMARGELHQIQLDAGRAGTELGEIVGWAKQVGVKAALRDVAELVRAARKGEGELRMLGGRAAVLESLETGPAPGGQVHESDGGTGIPPHKAGEGTSPPDLTDAVRPAGIPADFTFGDEDLARIGTGLDPSQPPPQNYWNEELVNTVCDLGRQRGGVTDADGHAHLQLARQLLDGAEGQSVELGAAEIAVALKAAGIPLEKVDPNQLHSAARYVNTATDAAEQHDKLRKTLDNFQALTTVGSPPLSRQQMVEQLWAIAKVPGHALEKLSTTELQGKFQEVLSTVNAGPGRAELKVGKHNLKLTVGENGQVTQSETKKPGFFSRLGGVLKKIAPLALTVASFIPFTAPFARIAQGAISLVKAIRSKSLLGAVISAAGIVAGGAAAIAGRVADGASSAAATVARFANGAARGLQGVSSIRQGSVLGGIAALGSGVAEAIGRAAEGAATGLQRFANRLGDTSAKLSYAARGMGIVDGYRAASAAVNDAKVALRQAEASGDPAAIAASRQQLQVAEKAKKGALLGGAASAAGLAADIRADHTLFPGDAKDSPIPQTGLDQALRGASRGLSVAQGVQSGDYASAGVNALGLAAVGRAALGAETPDKLGLTDAANLADAGLAYHQTNAAGAAADQAVAGAEAALEAARGSGDTAAVQAAQANLDQARRAREGALMGAIGAGDSLVLTAAGIGQKFHDIREVQRIKEVAAEQRAAFDKEVERAVATWEDADEQEQAWLEQVRDESLSPQEREAAAAGIQALRQAKEAYNAAIEGAPGDPEALHAATVAFEDLQGQIETEVANRASAPAYAALRDQSPTPAPRRHGIATVERGMTVWEISQRSGVPVDRILEFNAEQGNSLDPRKLQIGQEVLVPLGEGDVQFTPKSVEEVRAMQWAEIEARRLAALEAPKVSSPEVPAPGEPDVRSLALAGLGNDRAFLAQDEAESSFQFLNPSTWIDTEIDDAKNQAREAYRDAVDRLEALAKDPAATQTQIHAALQYKNQAQLAFNGARGAVLDAVHETDFLSPVQEVAQEVQDAIHGVTGSAADWIEETGAPAPLVAAATLPLHIVDSVVDLDAGIIKGATGLVQGVAGVGAHPVETAKGAFTLFDQAAQTTLAAQAVQFLGEAAFGKFDSLDEAVQDWNERSDPLKLAQAQWDFTTDVGKAMLSESIEAWKKGKYSEAVGVFVGQNVDVVLGAGILKSARLGTAAKALDGASDVQRSLGAVGDARRVTDTTADAARAADAAGDAGKISGATADATKGVPPARPSWQASETDFAKQLEEMGFEKQGSYLGGEKVPYGTPGSVRPDLSSKLERLSVDVKNYEIATAKGRYRLVQDIVGQVESRTKNLPANMRQGIIIDIRGQTIRAELLERLLDRIVRRTNGVIRPENIFVAR
jgi:LysM repeat protein